MTTDWQGLAMVSVSPVLVGGSGLKLVMLAYIGVVLAEFLPSWWAGVD